jgi:regulatory protein
MSAGTITAIVEGRRGQVELYVDGELAVRLAPLVAAGAGLRIGASITGEQLAKLLGENTRRVAMDLALRYLSYRARSEHEITQYLTRRSIPQDGIDAIIERLRGLGLIDDAAFVQQWIEERQRTRPRGVRAIRQELRRKGIDGATIEPALPEDDPEDALALARTRASRLDRSERQAFVRRLSGFLLRRGYSYDTVTPIVPRLWEEEETA